MTSVEKEIRANFAGQENKALRARIRKAAATGGAPAVRAIAYQVGLTAHYGVPSLEAVARAIEAEAN